MAQIHITGCCGQKHVAKFADVLGMTNLIACCFYKRQHRSLILQLPGYWLISLQVFVRRTYSVPVTEGCPATRQDVHRAQPLELIT